MIKRRRFPRVFFGWWTVLAGGIIALWSAGYHTFGLSVLFKPIASELGFSRAATSVPASIGRLEGGFEGPFAGWATDRFGPKWIVFSGVFFIGLSLILMYFIDSLWAFYVVWGVILGTGFNIGATIPVDKAITNWFIKKRGLALSIKWMLMGLSGALVLPLIAWLITTRGWRMTCLIGGVVMWIVGLPLAWFFIKRHRPEYYGLLPDGATTKEATASSPMIDKGVKYAAEVGEVEFTLRQAMKTPAFWVLATTNAVHSMAHPAITLHGVPFLTDRGVEPLVAAGILAIAASASLPFRLVGGFLADHVRKDHIRFIIVGAYFMQALAFATFLLNQTIAMIYVWFILYYIGHGTAMTPLPAMRARYFGRKAFGSIQGVSMAVGTPIGIVAPIYAGWVYDITGSYISAFILIAVLLAFSAVLACFILPPKPPAQITDIRKLV